MTNHQRKGAISNAHVGRDFEAMAKEALEKEGIIVESKFKISVGWEGQERLHEFDLGSEGEPGVLVECKAHTWTESGGIPSAKFKNWSEAMLIFALAPKGFQKLFVVQKDSHPRRALTLATYYLEKYGHLVPPDVVFWELDVETKELEKAEKR